MDNLKVLAAAALASAALSSPLVVAAQTLDIYACYACQNTGNAAIDAALAANPSVAADGLLFAFFNTGATTVTNATFAVSGANPNDSFKIGSIAAGASFIALPGLSDDGGTHGAGGLFESVGATRDTSDGQGGVTDLSVFSFTALLGGHSASSGAIVAGDPALIRTWRDPGATGQTSFLGLGPNGDGGCTNCYFGKIGSVVSVPETETYAMMLAGLGALGIGARRRKT